MKNTYKTIYIYNDHKLALRAEKKYENIKEKIQNIYFDFRNKRSELMNNMNN